MRNTPLKAFASPLKGGNKTLQGPETGGGATNKNWVEPSHTKEIIKKVKTKILKDPQDGLGGEIVDSGTWSGGIQM